ncbi:hypothetical protein [Pectobacterium parmentieri]|uniref:hypothetical protein n=1 Tax=Pectobacterium parmentieri TaxID=1905730 RepID=UPI0015E826C7|nr:hypothetical protein [Pectobacterium parmentieri]
MTDIIDAANDLTDLNIQHALANRPPPPVFTGKCRNCDETIGAGNYCDKYCREDYEKR